MLPAISLAHKCKFINADREGTLKRMEMTRFEEDQLAINLAEVSAKKLKVLGYNPEELVQRRQSFIEEKIGSVLTKRKEKSHSEQKVGTIF